MNIEKMENGSPEPKKERMDDGKYRIVNSDGSEELIWLNPDELGDVVYIVYMEDDARNHEMLSRDDLIRGTVDQNEGKVIWEDGKETDTSSKEDVVYARKNNELNELSERQIIPNIMIGEVDKEAKTISFDKLPKK